MAPGQIHKSGNGVTAAAAATGKTNTGNAKAKPDVKTSSTKGKITTTTTTTSTSSASKAKASTATTMTMTKPDPTSTSVMMMTTPKIKIDELGFEILDLIFSYFSNDDGNNAIKDQSHYENQQSLLGFCNVSKGFYRVARYVARAHARAYIN